MERSFLYRLRILTLLSLLGVLVASYLISQHYKNPGQSFCNVSDYVSCDVVNKSKYSEILGIPVAVPAVFAYAFFTVMNFAMLRNRFWKNKRKTLGLLALLSGAGLLFSLYLTFIEFFVLRALCVFCITQQIIILLLFLIYFSLWLKTQKSSV